MIEAIVSAALAGITEGSGGVVVDLIRRYLSKKHESPKALEALDRVEAGRASEDDKREIQALLVRYANTDSRFLGQLQSALASVGAMNSVTHSKVQKLVQAQHVGDVTM